MSDGPRTFPGSDWYQPYVSASPHATVRPAPEDEAEQDAIKQREQERKARGIGFTAAMHEPDR